MARVSELIGLGVPAQHADILGAEATAGASGAGSAQGDATPLVTQYTRFTTVGASTGARLPPASGRGDFMVVNAGANALLVYPASGESINGGSANAAFSVTNGKTALFKAVGNTWFANLSA